jgi:hypothetical protein
MPRKQRAKLKRRLTRAEEFQIMSMVLDKFLWIGTGLMAWGLFQAIQGDGSTGLYFILTGAIVLVLFSVIIVREFEHLR